MKKITLLLILAILVLSTSAFAASVSRNMASRASPGDDIAVTFSISGVNVGEVFTLEDQAPQGWRVDAWNVVGAQGGKDAVDYRFVAADNRHGFSFTAESANPTISFTVKVPTTASGDYSFDAVYFDSLGQSKTPGTVTVRTITCGDGICEGGENSDSCLADCPVAAPAPEPTPSPTEAPAGEETEGDDFTSTIILVVVVLLLVGAFFLYKKRKTVVPKTK